MKFVEKKISFKKITLIIFIVVQIIYSTNKYSHAANTLINSIAVHGGYTFETFKGQKVVSVYISIFNNSEKDRKIKFVSSSLSNKAELHSHIKDGNIIKMIKIDEVTISAKDQFFFQPGKTHIMIFELSEQLKDGDEFDLTFQFNDGELIDTKIKVLNKSLRNMKHI